jgi:NAD dependent epimerase/dehydratase family enzyme
MTQALGKILHRPAMLPPVPAFLLKGVFGEFSDVFVKGQKVLPRKLLQDGFGFEYPEIEAAFAHLIN